MGAFLRSLQRPRAVRRVTRPLSPQEIRARDDGRLFEGKAPNRECNARRRILLAQWDRWVAYFRCQSDPQGLLRWLRACHIERKRELQGSQVMRFIEALNEARSYERKLRNNPDA